MMTIGVQLVQQTSGDFKRLPPKRHLCLRHSKSVNFYFPDFTISKYIWQHQYRTPSDIFQKLCQEMKTNPDRRSPGGKSMSSFSSLPLPFALSFILSMKNRKTYRAHFLACFLLNVEHWWQEMISPRSTSVSISDITENIFGVVPCMSTSIFLPRNRLR